MVINKLYNNKITIQRDDMNLPVGGAVITNGCWVNKKPQTVWSGLITMQRWVTLLTHWGCKSNSAREQSQIDIILL